MQRYCNRFNLYEQYTWTPIHEIQLNHINLEPNEFLKWHKFVEFSQLHSHANTEHLLQIKGKTWHLNWVETASDLTNLLVEIQYKLYLLSQPGPEHA